jgi:hypothetical protein
MADNPLDPDDPARQQRIRERAYHLWQADGCPPGHDREYWERAEALTGLDADPTAGQLAPAADPVEEADLQDNLGEFPDRLADQGEVQPTPRRRPSR